MPPALGPSSFLHACLPAAWPREWLRATCHPGGNQRTLSAVLGHRSPSALTESHRALPPSRARGLGFLGPHRAARRASLWHDPWHPGCFVGREDWGVRPFPTGSHVQDQRHLVPHWAEVLIYKARFRAGLPASNTVCCTWQQFMPRRTLKSPGPFPPPPPRSLLSCLCFDASSTPTPWHFSLFPPCATWVPA